MLTSAIRTPERAPLRVNPLLRLLPFVAVLLDEGEDLQYGEPSGFMVAMPSSSVVFEASSETPEMGDRIRGRVGHRVNFAVFTLLCEPSPSDKRALLFFMDCIL